MSNIGTFHWDMFNPINFYIMMYMYSIIKSKDRKLDKYKHKSLKTKGS